MAPKNNHDPSTSSDTNTNVQEADLQEMEEVNQSLDALSGALDAFEQRTDNIMVQLRELLDSNREIRRQIAQEKNKAGSNSDNDDEDDKNMNVEEEQSQPQQQPHSQSNA